MNADTVYVAELSRECDEPETYHEHKDCRALARASGCAVTPRDQVDGLGLCAVCAGADLTGTARVLLQADPDDYPAERGRSR